MSAFTPLADAIEHRHYPCGRDRDSGVAEQIAHYAACTNLGCIAVDTAFNALWFAMRRAGAKKKED